MEDLRRNLASPTRSVKKGCSVTNKSSQSDLRPKMRSLRGKENELQLQQQQTPNKPIPTKHFMSPTFSAASKARKKLSLMESNQQDEEYATVTFSTTSSNLKKNVFIERNEDYTVSIYTCEQQTLASPTHPLSPVITPTASKPYDPLTNYLTPRPKFLLYNPDKQRDNVGLTDSHDFHEISSNGCSSSPSSPHHEEGLESIEFEDDSDEEKQGMLYKVIKFLFVLGAIVFSTLYISSMNSPKNGNLLTLQGYQMILDQSFQDSANDFALGSVFWNQTLGKETSLREATQSVILDQIHLPDEGKLDTETSDLLQVFVDDNVVDPIDLPEKGETNAGTLSVTNIQDLPSVAPTDEKVSACEGSTGGEGIVFEYQAETAVNVVYAIEASYIVDNTNSSGESAKMEEVSYKIEGEVASETSDLLQVSANENVVGQVLEDSSKLSDPLDQVEQREFAAETLRLPYVTDIQDLASLAESTDEKLTAYVGTGEEEMVSEHQVGTAANSFDAIEASNIVDNTDASGESAKKDAISYKLDEQRIILGDILGTCELVNAARGLSDDQTMRTEAMVTDVVLAMGGIASLVGGIALLAIILGYVWRLFTKPFERVPSPVIQECVEPALAEDSRDSLLANKDESTEEKEQFDVDRRLIELCHFRAPTVELLGEYVVTPAFTRSSPQKYTCESSPVEPQQTKQGIFPDRPSISSSCSNTSLDSSRRFSQDKTVGKEEGSTTALRRSNRLRNKTVFSPL